MGTIRKLVVIGDQHFGSASGLFPPDWSTVDGLPVAVTTAARWLWDQWIEFTTEWLPSQVGAEPFGLVINGDITQGCALARKGDVLVAATPVAQYQLAMHVLAPLAAKAAKVWIVNGTPVHAEDIEKHMAGPLGALPSRSGPTHQDLRLMFNGFPLLIRHHGPAGFLPHTRGAAVARSIIVERGRGDFAGEQIRARGLIYNHVHQHDYVSNSQWFAMSGLPWQLPTDWALRTLPGIRTEVGGHVLHAAGHGEMPRLSTFQRFEEEHQWHEV